VSSLHKTIRGAVKTEIVAALAAESITGVSVHEQDVPGEPSLPTLPCVIVSYAGPETEIGGTNLRDDWQYPISVGLYTTESEGTPVGVEVTRFRQIVRKKFHNKRLNGVPEVWICQYDGQAPVVDEDAPAIEHLRTACVITAVARVGRT